MIYFDNAATTAMSDIALQALIEVSKNQYGNPSSAYSLGRKSRQLIEESRRTIAGCIGAEPEEIFFTSGGTEGANWAISKAAYNVNKIITSQVEHHAVLHPIKHFEYSGINLNYLSVDRECIICKKELIKSLDGAPVLASIMFQNNETGALQPIQELAEFVHNDNKNSIFFTDAVQAVGHTHIDVKKLGVDILSASAHKFNGPKGVGFLYKRKNCSIKPFLLGGGQERGMRSGTEDVAEIYAMSKALEDNVNNMRTHQTHIRYLEQMLLTSLSKQGIAYSINADSSQRAAGILNIAIDGIDGEGLLNVLDMHNICISTGSACNSESQERSHVLKAIGLDDDTIDSSVRISIGRYNTEAEIEEIVKYIIKYNSIANNAHAWN